MTKSIRLRAVLASMIPDDANIILANAVEIIAEKTA